MCEKEAFNLTRKVPFPRQAVTFGGTQAERSRQNANILIYYCRPVSRSRI